MSWVYVLLKTEPSQMENVLEKIRKILATFQGDFLQVIEGNTIVTIISDLNSFNEISSIFEGKHVIDQNKNLATIIIRSPDEITATPGCVQAFYNALSRRHINIEETMSCYTETIIVLKMEDVSKAFAALTDLITQARTKTVE